MSTTLIPVKLDYAIDGIVCGDIAITAAEGGIGYWCQIEKYDYRRWAPDGGDFDVADDFVFYTLLPDDATQTWARIDVTAALIKRGIDLYLNGSSNTAARGIAEISDLSEVDSNEADLIVQLGAFSKEVYG